MSVSYSDWQSESAPPMSAYPADFRQKLIVLIAALPRASATPPKTSAHAVDVSISGGPKDKLDF